jgi:hypothetical protein
MTNSIIIAKRYFYWSLEWHRLYLDTKYQNMKNAMRVVLTFFAFIASYFFIFWVPFAFIPGARNIAWLPQMVSLIAAIGISVFLWKKTGSMSTGLASSILIGGIIVGSIGFIGGFIGPMIFYPEANQGPLLGIFITGPIGFVIGLIGGGLYWWVLGSKKANRGLIEQPHIPD